MIGIADDGVRIFLKVYDFGIRELMREDDGQPLFKFVRIFSI